MTTSATAEATADDWRHSHVFDEGNPLAQRNSRWAVALTAAMMVAEIIGGWWYNSMALLADGWHMSSHALALGLSVLAYGAARRYAGDARFAFGTWKMEVLAGYTSAVLLVGVAAVMLYQSVERLIAPTPIHYNQAIAIAVLGLLVNLGCAWLLRDGQGHHHGHADHAGHHDHAPRVQPQQHHHHDLNLRSAYLHVIADAATSVLAIIALIGGKLWGANWLDPLMGAAGAVLVAVWARGLLRDSARVLLDAEMDVPVVAEIREAIAASPVPAQITDLHVWRVGRGKYACIVALSVAQPTPADSFRRLLAVHEELVHVTVEVNVKGAQATGIEDRSIDADSGAHGATGTLWQAAAVSGEEFLRLLPSAVSPLLADKGEAYVQSNLTFLQERGAAGTYRHEVLYAVNANQQVVGFRYFFYDPGTTFCHLFATFVDEAYRRQGIARQLIDESFKLAIARGCRQFEIRLTSPPTPEKDGLFELYCALGKANEHRYQFTIYYHRHLKQYGYH